VRQAQLVDGPRHLLDDLPRCHIEVADVLIQPVHVAARQLLPHLDPARVDDFRCEALGRPQEPRDERPQPLGLVAMNRLHHEVVVAHEHEEALVDARRVFELFVNVACGERRDRGVERGGVAEAGVLVAGGERARHAAHRSAARPRGADHFVGLALVFGAHLARGVHFGTGDVAVHVDAARHDDQAGSIESTIGTDVGICRWLDDLPVADPDIAALAVHTVNRIVDSPVRNLEVPAAHVAAGSYFRSSFTLRWIADSTSKSLGCDDGTAGRRKIGTSSMRYTVPGTLMP
jgi:hypothetical protein